MPALLFDFDGTIANSLPVILTASRLALEKLGRPYDEKTVASYVGLPLIKTGELLLGAGLGELYYNTYGEFFHELQRDSLTLFPGIIEMLRELKAKKVPLAIVTSKSQRGIESSLETVGLLDFFPVVVHANHDCGHKPEAGPALFALQKLRQPADKKSFFIGDSLFDISCGKAAGLSTCAVSWGAMTRDELLEAEPDYLVDHISELQKLLRQHF